MTLDLLILHILFFFFKQKTAYEMRISDWSSDVCSSDLVHHAGGVLDAFGEPQDAVERYATPTHRADAGITKHSLGFVHIGFPAAIRAQECAMDRDDAGVLLDRDNKGRRKSLGGTS